MTQQLPDLTFVRDLDSLDVSRQVHARKALRGDEVRLARGAYVPIAPWLDLEARDRYLVTIRAVSMTRRKEMVLSHWSAAALHGLPIVGPWPTKVHVSIGRVSGGRSRRGVIKHALVVADDDIVEVDGMIVTSVARTVLDLAVYADRLTAIVATDRALLIDRLDRTPPMVGLDELWDTYFARGNFRGAVRARKVLEFGETGSESPLESVSRYSMKIIGCPKPELQVAFRDHLGAIGYADFYWRRYRLVGEADGDSKYLDPGLRGGHTTAEVVLAEKRREDRIRAVGEGVTRWPWSVGVNPQALRAHLQAAGLPIP
jgi:hypothetical protein